MDQENQLNNSFGFHFQILFFTSESIPCSKINYTIKNNIELDD